MVQRLAISVWRPVMVGKTIIVRLLYSLINALEIIILLVILLVVKSSLITHGS
jgi:hypothetical protein